MDFNKPSIWNDISVGANLGYIDKLILEGNRDNANMQPNPEMMHKYTADVATKNYALLRMLSGEEAEFHVNGYGHIHDLEFMAFRPLNCLQHDLRFFIRNGLKVDGDGLHTSSAKSAKNIFTLVNHIGQILGAGQVNMSGGQSIPFINTFLAPYTSNIDDKTLKQAIQMLIFNINMSYVSRGGQSVFSSFNVDLEMPDFLIRERAWINGETYGEYGDYQDEAKRIAHMIIEVLLEGDGNGKPHLFPNTVFQLNDKVDYDEWNDLFELSAKYSLPYFNKAIYGKYSTVMGCRTRLATNWSGDWERDIIRTGNLGYISLNLPLYALRGIGTKDKRDFFEILRDNMNIAKNILIKRRLHGEYCLNKLNHLKFLTQPDIDGKPYYNIEDSTLSFGIVGLYETVEILCNGEYDSGIATGILQCINEYAQECIKETGYRWTVIASPAESTAGKFAIINRRKYGDRANVNGTTGAYYYSNGTHIPVNSSYLLPEKIAIETPYHKYTQGGNILNCFMGEAWTDPEVIKNLVKKIYDKTDVGFYTFSGKFTLCCKCSSRIGNDVDICYNCGSNELEVYDRITGYMQKVSGWNPSKQAEFKDRVRY